jgi:hypothetical protein
MFTGDVFRGRLELAGARFDAGVSLQDAQFDGHVDMTGVVVADFADLRWREPADVEVSGLVAAPGVTLKGLPAAQPVLAD